MSRPICRVELLRRKGAVDLVRQAEQEDLAVEERRVLAAEERRVLEAEERRVLAAETYRLQKKRARGRRGRSLRA
jgi:hypothetical protein